MPARRTILPPNATPLERAFDAAVPQWDALADQAEPAALRQNASMLPWMAAHWQISQFDRYFADPRALLENGLPWLRERGSAAAVRRAMGWLGYTSIRIEEEGALLHINPGAEVSLADLRRIAHVVRASTPLHVRFYRLFYRYDRRRLRLDTRPGLDNGLIGRDSGVPVDIDGDTVLASQGQFFGAVAQRPPNSHVQHQPATCWAHVVRRHDVMRLDAWRLDGPVRRPLAHQPTISTAHAVPAYQRLATQAEASPMATTTVPPLLGAVQLQPTTTTGVVVPRTLAARGWTGTWDSSPWQESQITTQHTEEPAP